MDQLTNREKMALRAIQVTSAYPEGRLTSTELSGLIAMSVDVSRRTLWSLRDKGYIYKKKTYIKVLAKGLEWLSVNGIRLDIDAELSKGQLDGLTSRQSIVMSSIVQFVMEWFTMPTYEEISEMVSMSVAGVEHHISLIAKKGWLDYKGKRLVLTRRARNAYGLHSITDPVETFRIQVENMKLDKDDILIVRFPMEIASHVESFYSRLTDSIRKVLGKGQRVLFFEKSLDIEKLDKASMRSIWNNVKRKGD